MSDDTSLYVVIEDSTEFQDNASARFLPAGCLDRLLTKEAITTALEKCNTPLLQAVDMGKLVQFICDEARRVFSTLIWIGKEDQIPVFFQAGFTDEMLPVVRSGRTLSSSKDKFSEKSKKAFNHFENDPRFITSFDDNQWIFLSPIFQRDQFEYGNLKQHRMPFMEKTMIDGGQFGEVAKCVIHPDHLDVDTKVKNLSNVL
jgi:hypothetical protein